MKGPLQSVRSLGRWIRPRQRRVERETAARDAQGHATPGDRADPERGGAFDPTRGGKGAGTASALENRFHAILPLDSLPDRQGGDGAEPADGPCGGKATAVELAHIQTLEEALLAILSAGREVARAGAADGQIEALAAALDRWVRFNGRVEGDDRLGALQNASGKGFSRLVSDLQEHVTAAAAKGRIRQAVQALNAGVENVRAGLVHHPAAMESELKHLHRLFTLIRSARGYWALHCRQEGRHGLADRILSKRGADPHGG